MNKYIAYGFLIIAAIMEGLKINVRVMYAQMILETGNFKSAVYKENNNVCGMKLPKIRKTKAIGENRGFAVYDTVFDSIHDLLLWCKYNNISTTDKDTYLSKIVSAGFVYGDNQYVNKINAIYDEL